MTVQLLVEVVIIAVVIYVAVRFFRKKGVEVRVIHWVRKLPIPNAMY
jgi:hypothetical protein